MSHLYWLTFRSLGALFLALRIPKPTYQTLWDIISEGSGWALDAFQTHYAHPLIYLTPRHFQMVYRFSLLAVGLFVALKNPYHSLRFMPVSMLLPF